MANETLNRLGIQEKALGRKLFNIGRDADERKNRFSNVMDMTFSGAQWVGGQMDKWSNYEKGRNLAYGEHGVDAPDYDSPGFFKKVFTSPKEGLRVGGAEEFGADASGQAFGGHEYSAEKLGFLGKHEQLYDDLPDEFRQGKQYFDEDVMSRHAKTTTQKAFDEVGVANQTQYDRLMDPFDEASAYDTWGDYQSELGRHELESTYQESLPRSQLLGEANKAEYERQDRLASIDREQFREFPQEYGGGVSSTYDPGEDSWMMGRSEEQVRNDYLDEITPSKWDQAKFKVKDFFSKKEAFNFDTQDIERPDSYGEYTGVERLPLPEMKTDLPFGEEYLTGTEAGQKELRGFLTENITTQGGKLISNEMVAYNPYEYSQIPGTGARPQGKGRVGQDKDGKYFIEEWVKGRDPKDPKYKGEFRKTNVSYEDMLSFADKQGARERQGDFNKVKNWNLRDRSGRTLYDTGTGVEGKGTKGYNYGNLYSFYEENREPNPYISGEKQIPSAGLQIDEEVAATFGLESFVKKEKFGNSPLLKGMLEHNKKMGRIKYGG